MILRTFSLVCDDISEPLVSFKALRDCLDKSRAVYASCIVNEPDDRYMHEKFWPL